MNQQKSNIKKLTHITLALLTAIFIVTGFDRSANIYHQYVRDNENYTNLVANSTESYFRQIDMVLDLIGNQLVRSENYKNTDHAKQVFQRMLSLNPAIIAYALISPEGDYLLTHLDTPAYSIPNVLTREAARESFLQTLESRKMVIGRTYTLNRTQKLAIPVRKAFYDSTGKPMAVMAVGVDATNSKIFDSALLNTNARIIHLFRAADHYRQLYIHNTPDKSPEKNYATPITEEGYNSVLDKISKHSGMPIAEFKKNGQAISFHYEEQLDNVLYLVSTRYITRLDLWASTYIKISEIRNSIFIDIAKLCILYLIITAVVLSLFRRMEDTENVKREALELAAHCDSLTGLNNRNFLINNTQLIIDHYRSFYFILIDIDGLKLINDIYGHAFGDDFLRVFARRLSSLTEIQGEKLRLSGDEFLLIADLGPQPEQKVAQVKKNLEQPITINDIKVNFTVSIGVAQHPISSNKLSPLISRADMALHEAKTEKGRTVFFDNTIEARFIRRALIEKHIPDAISNGEFTLHYQPQIRYPNGLFGVEALVRWQSPVLGFVSPMEFIPVAESSGLMPQLGEYIIEQACEEICRVKTKTQSNFQLSLNISAKQFLHPGFSEHLLRISGSQGFKACMITLELTESIFVHDIKQLTLILDQLRSEGYKISMDDFGTGFSSLSMLRNIPLNEIKIDKTFVDDITTDPSAEYVAKTIILIGQQLNYDVIVAEGTETAEQVALLAEQGCPVFQGYYFSKPLPAAQLEVFVQSSACCTADSSPPSGY